MPGGEENGIQIDQSDWDQLNDLLPAYIKNKPLIPSTFAAATVPEINAGTDNDLYASPFNLEGSKYLNQSGSKISAVASGIDSYSATIAPAIVAYLNTQSFYITFTNANTGPATLDLNGLGPINIFKYVSVPLILGDIKAGQVLCLSFDGTNFQINGNVGSSYSLINKYVDAINLVSTTSAAYVLISAMTLTVDVSGNYLVLFSSESQNSNGSATMTFAVFVNGVIVLNSERRFQKNAWGNIPLMVVVPSVAGQTIDVRVKTTLGTASIQNRSLNILKVS